MKGFTFDSFVDLVREAAQQTDANAAVRAVLAESVADPRVLIDATPKNGDDEVMLYEDNSVSIWRCCFQPHVVMPPHEHKMVVHIAGYSGVELSYLYQTETGELLLKEKVEVHPGQVVTLESNTIHAVTTQGDEPSYALHVYMGPLMKISRNLFDWDSGNRMEFSMDNFQTMKRSAAEMTFKPMS